MLIKLGITIASLPELRERIFTLYAIVYIEFFFFFFFFGTYVGVQKTRNLFLRRIQTTWYVYLTYFYLTKTRLAVVILKKNNKDLNTVHFLDSLQKATRRFTFVLKECLKNTHLINFRKYLH